MCCCLRKDATPVQLCNDVFGVAPCLIYLARARGNLNSYNGRYPKPNMIYFIRLGCRLCL
jgi:hypothetical protein